MRWHGQTSALLNIRINCVCLCVIGGAKERFNMISKIGNVKCQLCGREWVAACEHPDTKEVECPDCGNMVAVNRITERAPQVNKEANATSSNSESMPFEATGSFFDVLCPHCNKVLHVDLKINKR